MKPIIRILLTGLLLTFGLGENLQPYILIGEIGLPIERAKSEIVKRFFMSSTEMEIKAKFHPFQDENQYILILTHPKLQAIAAENWPGAPLLSVVRYGIFQRNGMTYLVCQNLPYWGQAFLQDNYSAVEKDLLAVQEQVLNTLPRLRMVAHKEFGIEAGLSPEFLRHFQMITEEKGLFGLFGKKTTKHAGFNDPLVLGEWQGTPAAISHIKQNLDGAGLSLVFEVADPARNWSLMGIDFPKDSPLLPATKQLETGSHRHTAFWPLVVVIQNGQVYTAHPNYIIPLGFPAIDNEQFKELLTVTPQISQTLLQLVKQ